MKSRKNSALAKRRSQHISTEIKHPFESEPWEIGVQHDVRYKVVLIGNSMVGKSSLLQCWKGDPFEPCLMPTVGLDFAGRIYNLDQGRLRLDIWDTAGQERYGTITSVHYRDAKGFIFVYDITSLASFDSLRCRWLNTVDEYVTEAVPIFIVGNKLDLSSDRREVSTEEGRRFAEQQGASGFFETSARLGTGVLEVFYEVACSMAYTWGILKALCDETEANGGTMRENGRCSKCNRTHKRKGIRLRASTLHLEGKNNINSNCCGSSGRKVQR